MRLTLFRSAWGFSWIIAALMLVQSACGLLYQDVYQDNFFVKSAWYGNDWVTLCLAVPLLLISLVGTRRGSDRARLLWLGMLAFTLYNYAFYVFGSVLSSFFLLFVLLFTAALYSLIFGLASLDAEALPFHERTPARRISAYMLLWGLMLSGLWILQSIRFAYTRELPQLVVATNAATNLTAILDLSLMVPAVFLSAYLLWDRQPWGYVLATVMNVKGALYALVLVVGSYIGSRNGIPGLADQIPLWLTFCCASLICCGYLLGNLPPLGKAGRPLPLSSAS